MASDIKSLSGMVFWSKVVMAIYMAGVNIVMIRAIVLKILVKVIFEDF